MSENGELLELAEERPDDSLAMLPSDRKKQRVAAILALEVSEAQVVWAAVPVPAPPPSPAASQRMARGSTSPATYPHARTPSRVGFRLCLLVLFAAACGLLLVHRGYVGLG
jgi:hypothetical protein